MNADFTSISEPFSNTINVGGVEYLYFGGTAYLGLTQNADFINLYTEGIKKFGLNNGTSRTNNIQLGIYREAEKVAAIRFGAEDALITSSGYLAAQLAVKALSLFGKVLYAPGTHPALWLENQSQRLESFTKWKTDVVQEINKSDAQNWVLISNSMNNLFPEIYDFDFLENVDPLKKIILIVDDSHGAGINNDGLGAFCKLPKKANIESIIVASMAKALGVDAGMILGSKEIIRELKNTNIFAGASPPSAAGLFSFIHGEDIYHKALKKLQKNIIHFSNGLNLTWKFESEFPAFFFNDPD
ncbi:MAG: aminotransferase class I/II-fold pyridoxal phosphate-dependent enzyme, partial [Sphingobacteriales bacterium]